MSRVKIIATLGPASDNEEIVYAMACEGVQGFRINFSHGSKEYWSKLVEVVRTVESKINRPIALIGDLQGPAVRLGEVEKPILLNKGDIIEIVFAEKTSGEDKRVPMPIHKFFEVVEEGDKLLLDDGRVVLAVEEAYSSKVVVRALTPGKISSHKAVVIKGKEVPLPAITSKDLSDIEFAIEKGFDYIALSYVRSGEDIKLLKRILKDKGAEHMGVIAKIETVSGIRKLPYIINEADVILVARGDLGMHFSLEEVPWLQRNIIKKCLEKGKPVIVATQILGSMMEEPTPTRAEVVDVVTAMTEGADALMLTGETAVGKYPLETVKWLRKIINAYENRIHYPREKPRIDEDERQRFAYSIVVLAEELNAKIVVFTKEGKTALRLARYRPSTQLFAASNNVGVLRKLSIVWGVNVLKVKAEGYVDGLEKAYEELIRREEVCYGDLIVLTYGIPEGEHSIRIVRVEKPF